MNDRTIKKLISGFISLILLTLLLGVIGWTGIAKINGILQVVCTTQLPTILSLEKIQRSLGVMQRCERVLLYEKDAGIISRQFLQLENAWKDSEHGWQVYAQLSPGGEERQLWQDVIQKWQAWKKLHQEILELIRQGDASSLKLAHEISYSKARLANIEARELLQNLIDLHLQETAAFNDKALSKTFEAKVLVGCGTLIGALLSIIIGALVCRSVKRAYTDLKISQEWFATTLNSIGDAVIATDGRGKVTFMNPVAEAMTGWTPAEAQAWPLKEIFPLVNEITGQPVEDPVSTVIRAGIVVGLANHTVLIAKDGAKIPIEDSGAPIKDEQGNVIGVVLVFHDATERRKAEEILRTLVFHAPIGLFLVQDGKFKLVNHSFEAITGYQEVELLGKDSLDWVTPEHREMVSRQTVQMLKGQRDIPYEFQIKDKNGKIKWVLEKVTSINYQGQKMVLGYFMDITEKKFLTEDLLREKRFIDVAIDSLPGVFYFFDEQLRFIRWNKNFEAITGYSSEEFALKSPLDFFAIPEANRLKQKIQEVFEKGEAHAEAELISQRGDKIPFFFTGKLITYEQEKYLIGMGIDISQRRLAEEEKAKLEIQLRQSQKIEAIGTLAGGIAHDFNNILGIIIGYSELLNLEITATNPLRTNIDQILRAGHRAKELVKQILTFSRKDQQERHPISAKKIVKEALQMLRASIPTTIDIQENIQCDSAILANHSQFHQVILNLCTNAAHALGAECGVLAVSLIDLDFTDAVPHPDLQNGAYIKLSVRDTGHGITPEVMERIFDPFFTTKELGVGTGLGLSVVHGIVKAHQGAITVDSEPGKGSVFNVYLPRIVDNIAIEAQDDILPLPAGQGCILFVDDEDSLVKLGKKILVKLGYEVVGLTSSLEALAAFQAQPDKFDLVITDYTMPHMTGIQLAQKMLELRSDLPIILCTGYTSSISTDQAKDLGIKEFLLKPLNISKLSQIIRRVLDERTILNHY